jgi:orotate phosphoribosyltransferase
MDDLARRIRMASKLLGNFTLRSGRVSDTYFDKNCFGIHLVLLLAITNAATTIDLAKQAMRLGRQPATMRSHR